MGAKGAVVCSSCFVPVFCTHFFLGKLRGYSSGRVSGGQGQRDMRSLLCVLLIFWTINIYFYSPICAPEVPGRRCALIQRGIRVWQKILTGFTYLDDIENVFKSPLVWEGGKTPLFHQTQHRNIEVSWVLSLSKSCAISFFLWNKKQDTWVVPSQAAFLSVKKVYFFVSDKTPVSYAIGNDY